MTRIAFALLSLLFIQEAVQAQAYPARSVRIIVPFGAGGPGRPVRALRWRRAWPTRMGQPFVVENRPGGGAVSAPMWWPSRPRTATRC